MPEISIEIARSEDDVQGYEPAESCNYQQGRLSTGKCGPDTYRTGWRYQNVPIPKGATIIQAYMTFKTASDTTPGTTNTRFLCVDDDNIGDIHNCCLYICPFIPEYVDWNVPTWPTADELKQSPELKTIIQAIIDRAGWQPGNSLAIIWRSIGGLTGVRDVKSLDWGNYKTTLYIKWEEKMKIPKGTPIDWGWGDIAPEDMAAVEVGDLKAPTKPLDMASQKITSLPTPTTGSEPATKEFVESLVQGLDWQQSVLGELDTPPGTPAAGDRYLVIATATGDWVGHENDIAEWDGSVWVFTTPNTGFAVWIEDVGRQKVYNGTNWVSFGTTVDHGNLIGLADDDHAQYLNQARHDLPARHTLGTVVPHDNLADLAEKAHASLTGVGSSDHHPKTGNYEVYGLTEKVTSVPTPEAGNVGRFMRERASAGQATKVYICVENSADGYEWVQLGVST